MLYRLLVAALLSSAVLAVQPEQRKRQADGGAQFSAAASQLIAEYVPSSVYSALLPSIQAAASGASVSYSDVQSLFYSALLATSVPAWFNSAIPSGYSQQFQSLEVDVSSLRGVVISAQATAVVTIPVYVPVTTTDSAGSTFTTSVLSAQTVTGPITQTNVVGTVTTVTVPPPTTTVFTNSAGSTITSVISAGAGLVTTTFTNSAGSTITSVISAGAGLVTTTFTNSAGSTITSVISPSLATSVFTNSFGSTITSVFGVGISGASSLATAIGGGATSIGGVITGAGGSVIGGASSALAPASTTKAGNAAARPTAGLQGGVAAAAAVLVGVVGVVIGL